MTLTDENRIEALEKRMAARDRWEAEHDGRTNAWWDAQRSWNGTCDTWQHAIGIRMSAIERKIMWIAGFAAAVGALAGNLLTN